MKDEIKEILDNLAFTNDNYMWCDKTTLDTKKSHILLDYITNLQEEKDDYKNKFWEEQEQCEYLQDRIDKAIEYIEKGNKHFKENYNEPYEYAFMVNADEIMKILKGKSDE